VFDTGVDADQPFIVMERIRGRTLQEALDAGGLTEDRGLQVAADVCGALATRTATCSCTATSSPGNIMLAEDGSVKVTDFGIARAISDETVTATAAVLGTAAYLSPEQAQGRRVDARSDLYSLGVVLYELLTGKVPFSGESAVSVALQHVRADTRAAPPARPAVSRPRRRSRCGCSRRTRTGATSRRRTSVSTSSAHAAASRPCRCATARSVRPGSAVPTLRSLRIERGGARDRRDRRVRSARRRLPAPARRTALTAHGGRPSYGPRSSASGLACRRLPRLAAVLVGVVLGAVRAHR
jgi:serine/threonine protein kinase